MKRGGRRLKYGKIYDLFWDDEKVEELSDDAAFLAVFLVSGPHRNAIGCFRLGPGAITDRPRFGRWGIDRVVAALEELEFMRFIVRDKAGWILIRNALKYDEIIGPKQAVHAFELAQQIPRHSTVWRPLLQILLPQLLRHSRYLDGRPGWPIDPGSPDGVPDTVSDAPSEAVSKAVPDTVSDRCPGRSSDASPKPLQNATAAGDPAAADRSEGWLQKSAKLLKYNGKGSGNAVPDTVSETVCDSLEPRTWNLEPKNPPVSDSYLRKAGAGLQPPSGEGGKGKGDDGIGVWSAYDRIRLLAGLRSSPTDIGTVTEWLRAGIDLEHEALPAIREYIWKRPAGAEPIRSLKYFRGIVDRWAEQRGRRRGPAPMGPHGKRYASGDLRPGDLVEPRVGRQLIRFWLEAGARPETWPLKWASDTPTPLPGQPGCPIEQAVIDEFQDLAGGPVHAAEKA